MCGVFGFISQNGSPVNLSILAEIAITTMQRGPHAWGLAWIDGDKRMHTFKQTGKIVDALGLLRMAEGARALIGHCRYATHGDPENNLNNHPHPSDGGWIVHNGVVRNHLSLIEEHQLHPVTQCDSEVLGLLIAQAEGRLIDRVAETVELVDSAAPLVLMGLWKPGRVVVARRGNPLHRSESRGALWFGSLADGLPGRIQTFKDRGVELFNASLPK